MNKRTLTFAVGIVAFAIAVTLIWRYGYRLGLEPSEAVIDRMSDQEKTVAMKAFPKEPMTPAELPIDEKKQENNQAVHTLSEGTPERVASFEGVTIHRAEGMVRVVKVGEVLQLVFDEAFNITDGPGLYVYVSPKVIGSFRDLKESGIELAKLKATRGTQVYDLPAGTTLEDIRSIIVACKPYRVLFGKAIIQ